jgi:hypothetical protein
MGSCTALTPAQEAVLTVQDIRFAKAQAVYDAALRAPEVGIEQGANMTPLEAKIAKDANEPARNAPVYLSMARSLVELKAKLDAGLADTQAPKLVHHVVHLVKPREYERVELGPVIEAEVVNPKDQGKPTG